MDFFTPYFNIFRKGRQRINISVVSVIVFSVFPNFSDAFSDYKIASGIQVGNAYAEDTISKNSSFEESLLPFQINLFDTIYFNIAGGNINGAIIDIPVSVSSNDTIYSLDFSFKYNILDLVLDSIINFTSGLQYLYHYNTTDSIFRFTSNRLTPIPNDSTILHIRFSSLSGQLCAPDIDSTITYLNGEVCSNSITGCLVTTVQFVNEQEFNAVIFPNPATDFFYVTEKVHNLADEIIISDQSGIIVKKYSGFQANRFDIEPLKPGLYFIEMNNKTSGFFRKEKLIKL